MSVLGSPLPDPAKYRSCGATGRGGPGTRTSRPCAPVRLPRPAGFRLERRPRRGARVHPPVSPGSGLLWWLAYWPAFRGGGESVVVAAGLTAPSPTTSIALTPLRSLELDSAVRMLTTQ